MNSETIRQSAAGREIAEKIAAIEDRVRRLEQRAVSELARGVEIDMALAAIQSEKEAQP